MQCAIRNSFLDPKVFVNSCSWLFMVFLSEIIGTLSNITIAKNFTANTLFKSHKITSFIALFNFCSNITLLTDILHIALLVSFSFLLSALKSVVRQLSIRSFQIIRTLSFPTQLVSAIHRQCRFILSSRLRDQFERRDAEYSLKVVQKNKPVQRKVVKIEIWRFSFTILTFSLVHGCCQICLDKTIKILKDRFKAIKFLFLYQKFNFYLFVLRSK